MKMMMADDDNDEKGGESEVGEEMGVMKMRVGRPVMMSKRE